MPATESLITSYQNWSNESASPTTSSFRSDYCGFWMKGPTSWHRRTKKLGNYVMLQSSINDSVLSILFAAQGQLVWLNTLFAPVSLTFTYTRLSLTRLAAYYQSSEIWASSEKLCLFLLNWVTFKLVTQQWNSG